MSAMRVEHGKLVGDQTVTEDLSLQGTVCGNVEVKQGTALDMGGTITGNLIIGEGGICKLDGMVCGDVVNRGGVLRIRGTIQGRLIRQAGATEIDPQAVIGSIQDNPDG